MPAVQNFSICAALAVFLDFCLQVIMCLFAYSVLPHARLWTFRKSPHALHTPVDTPMLNSQGSTSCLQMTPLHPFATPSVVR